MSFREPARSGVFIAAVGPTVVGADEATGKVLWKHTIGSPKEEGVARLGLLDDRLIVGRNHDLHCLDQRSGATIWKVESPIVIKSVIVASNKVFVAVGGEVACFDEKGELLWHELLRGLDGPVTLVVGGQIIHADRVKGDDD